IGVKGFFISCAMRRATSLHAAARWAANNSERSSMTKTTTLPASELRLRAVAVKATGIAWDADPRVNRTRSVTHLARRALRNSRSKAIRSSIVRRLDNLAQPGGGSLNFNIAQADALIVVTQSF